MPAEESDRSESFLKPQQRAQAEDIALRRFNVLIVDEHELVRAGVRVWLQRHPEIAQIAECGTGAAALQQLRNETWHLVVLDIALPDRNGLDLLRQIGAQWPSSRVLIVSSLAEKHYAQHALRAGAAGYWEKGQSPESLLDAVTQVLAGRRFVSQALSEWLATQLANPRDQPPHAALTAREFQIFYKLAGGHAVSQVADELCLSATTITTYRKRIARKMGLQRSADFTRYALAHGLFSPTPQPPQREAD